MKTIIFDFDGTIADTTENGIRIINQMAEEIGFKPLDLARMDEYKNMTNKELLDEAHVPLHKLPKLLKNYKKRVNATINTCKVFTGIPELLELLSQNYKLLILSSNSVENISKFLVNNDIEKYFSQIYSESNLFGKHRAIKKVLKKHNLDIDSTIYVGDEVRDIEACKKVGLKIIAVSWGINSKEFLQSYQPEYLVEKPAEIFEIFSAKQILEYP